MMIDPITFLGKSIVGKEVLVFDEDEINIIAQGICDRCQILLDPPISIRLDINGQNIGFVLFSQVLIKWKETFSPLDY